MPIGNSAGVQFEDDLEAAKYEIENGFVLGPTIEQMRDPMEIDPSVVEDPSFDAYLKDAEFSSSERPRTKLYVTPPQVGEQEVQDYLARQPDPRPLTQRVSEGIGNFLSGIANLRMSEIVTGAVESAVGAVTLPNDVLTGKIDPRSPKAIERAFDLAGMMVFGPAPIASKVADGTLGSFAGVSANLPKDKLMRAKELVDEFGSDVDKDQLWKETGFFRGVDGKLRYEIDDSNAILKDVPDEAWMNPLKLERILEHQLLYEAYPELKDVTVKFNPRLPDGTAEYDYNTKTISLSAGSLENGPSILLHEIQHWIQHKEGFAAGGTTAEAFMLRWQGEVDTLAREGEKLKTKARKEGLTPEERKRNQYIKKVLQLDKERHQAAPYEAYTNYRRLAGEEEAYNVERRFNDGEYIFDEATDVFAQARDLHPLKTMGIPADEQAVFPRPRAATPYGYGDPMNPKADSLPPMVKDRIEWWKKTYGEEPSPEQLIPAIKTRIGQIQRDITEFNKTGSTEGYAPKQELAELKRYLKDIESSGKTGSEKPPIQFRRAANDNAPLDPSQGKDPFQLPQNDAMIDKMWNDLIDKLGVTKLEQKLEIHKKTAAEKMADRVEQGKTRQNLRDVQKLIKDLEDTRSVEWVKKPDGSYEVSAFDKAAMNLETAISDIVDLESVLGEYARKNITAKDVQKAFKRKGWTVNLRGKEGYVEATDSFGDTHLLQF